MELTDGKAQGTDYILMFYSLTFLRSAEFTIAQPRNHIQYSEYLTFVSRQKISML